MKKLKSNPIITALEDYDGAVEVAGYVGRNENGQVRLYVNLDLAAYLEVDASDIIHVIDAERDDEPARFFVRDSADVEVVSKSRVKAVALRQTDDKPGGGGGGKSCADQSFDYWLRCVKTGQSIESCTAISRIVEDVCKAVKGVVGLPDTATR